MDWTIAVKTKALELGFSLVGLTLARPAPHLDDYLQWLEAGQQGEMRYLARPDRVLRRRDLNAILPGAKTIVVVGMDYAPPTATPRDAVRIAAYAQSRDYHDILLAKLKTLGHWLRQESGGQVNYRAYVDTGALLERGHAQQAGLGFIGKNTLLIHPHRGSYFFLGELITDLQADTCALPHPETMCGTCARCITACPIRAFPRPYVLDARRCISYLTIEHAGFIDHALRPLMGNWIFGCDVCQSVCPWQRFAASAPAATCFNNLSIDELLTLDEARFAACFNGSPVKRIGLTRLVRNACIAAGNQQSAAQLPALTALFTAPSPLIRAHAAWAVARIMGPAASLLLQDHLALDPDPAVRHDLQLTLSNMGTVL